MVNQVGRTRATAVIAGPRIGTGDLVFFTRYDRTEWTVRANSDTIQGIELMMRKHRFDVWVIVREGNVVTQYLSEREASRYVNARNRNQCRPAFQTVCAIAEVEVAVSDSTNGET